MRQDTKGDTEQYSSNMSTMNTTSEVMDCKRKPPDRDTDEKDELTTNGDLEENRFKGNS